MKRLVFVVLSLLFLGCPEEKPVEPPPTNPLHLTVEDASCTEVFLKISLADDETNRSVTLKRNDTLVAAITMSGSDSLFVDEGLLPNKTYTYTLMQNNWSATAQATTMDTTSHDWAWQIDTLGTSASVLYDVAIINDTLAYAVGEIHTNETDKFDSLGNWINPYNVARWNGKKWELMRVYYNYNGEDLWSPIRAIFAPSVNDIWFAVASVIHWDGKNFQSIQTPMTGVVNKIWGRTGNDFYMVGNNGSIVHYSHGNWQKIESGTTLHINDIYGDYNEKTKEWEILAIASNQFTNQGKKLLQIRNATVTSLTDSGLSWALNTLWFKTKRKYIIGGDGLYISRMNNLVWQRDITQPPYYKTSVRGDKINNIIVCGAYGLMLSFNGVSWYNHQPVTYLQGGAFGRVAVQRNLVIAVGGISRQAIVAIGKR